MLATTNITNKEKQLMKENNNQTMLFKAISGKKIEVDFKGGNTSSDAGLLLLRESEKRIGLFQKTQFSHDITHGLFLTFQEGVELLARFEKVLPAAVGANRFPIGSGVHFFKDHAVGVGRLVGQTGGAKKATPVGK